MSEQPACPVCGGRNGGTIAVSWGRFARPYVERSAHTFRVCVGWVALTYMGRDLDCLIEQWIGPGARAFVCDVDENGGQG